MSSLGELTYFFPPHKRLLNWGQHSFPIVIISRGKWPINSFEIKCWQVKQDS